ncbi:MAG TPA: hypothetical protein VIL36_19765 [Acidimicrobiales bacterium]
MVAESIVVFTVVKLVGAAYLVYLGVQAFRSPRRLAAIGGTGGLVTVALGVRLAATGRRD